MFDVWDLFRMLKLKWDTVKPLLSGPPINWADTVYKADTKPDPEINVLYSETSIKRTLGKVPMVSAYRGFHCISYVCYWEVIWRISCNAQLSQNNADEALSSPDLRRKKLFSSSIPLSSSLKKLVCFRSCVSHFRDCKLKDII